MGFHCLAFCHSANAKHIVILSLWHSHFRIEIVFEDRKAWPEVLKHSSCSTQLGTKFQLLIKAKIQTNEEFSCFKSLRCCIYHANNCLNANNCWHFNIYEQDKVCAQLG